MAEDSRIFLGLGSNIEDRYNYLKTGIYLLNTHSHIWVIDHSPVYQSSPLYYADQEDFYNMVIEIETNLEPLQLLDEIKKIEHKAGRIDIKKKNTYMYIRTHAYIGTPRLRRGEKKNKKSPLRGGIEWSRPSSSECGDFSRLTFIVAAFYFLFLLFRCDFSSLNVYCCRFLLSGFAFPLLIFCLLLFYNHFWFSFF